MSSKWSDMVEEDEVVQETLFKTPNEPPCVICKSPCIDLVLAEEGYGKFRPHCSRCVNSPLEIEQRAFAVKCDRCGSKNNLFHVKITKDLYRIRCQGCDDTSKQVKKTTFYKHEKPQEVIVSRNPFSGLEE